MILFSEKFSLFYYFKQKTKKMPKYLFNSKIVCTFAPANQKSFWLKSKKCCTRSSVGRAPDS